MTDDQLVRLPSDQDARRERAVELFKQHAREARPDTDYTPDIEYLEYAIIEFADAWARNFFPYEEGDTIVLGPEVFAANDGTVVCWKGQNFVPQGDTEGNPSVSFRSPGTEDEEVTIEGLKTIQEAVGWGDRHVLYLGEDGFVIAHTDAEREYGRSSGDFEAALQACPLHGWLAAVDAPPLPTGYMTVEGVEPGPVPDADADTGWKFTPFDPVDLPKIAAERGVTE